MRSGRWKKKFEFELSKLNQGGSFRNWKPETG